MERCKARGIKATYTIAKNLVTNKNTVEEKQVMVKNMDKNLDRPSMLYKFTEEEIIEFAEQMNCCTENTGKCFGHEICPISHSPACCLHCTESAHVLASQEDRDYIKENFICKDPRCFRAVAILFLGAKLKESKIGMV